MIIMATKYGPKKIKKVMKEYGQGRLTSGKSHQRVKSRKQAVAIAISEARREGDKVPAEPREKRKKQKE
jgi:hypothetical protein